ncbi:MAG: hypothetical protein Q9176_007519 [Flavoplaca citrina]
MQFFVLAAAILATAVTARPLEGLATDPWAYTKLRLPSLPRLPFRLPSGPRLPSWPHLPSDPLLPSEPRLPPHVPSWPHFPTGMPILPRNFNTTTSGLNPLPTPTGDLAPRNLQPTGFYHLVPRNYNETSSEFNPMPAPTGHVEPRSHIQTGQVVFPRNANSTGSVVNPLPTPTGLVKRQGFAPGPYWGKPQSTTRKPLPAPTGFAVRPRNYNSTTPVFNPLPAPTGLAERQVPSPPRRHFPVNQISLGTKSSPLPTPTGFVARDLERSGPFVATLKYPQTDGVVGRAETETETASADESEVTHMSLGSIPIKSKPGLISAGIRSLEDYLSSDTLRVWYMGHMTTVNQVGWSDEPWHDSNREPFKKLDLVPT